MKKVRSAVLCGVLLFFATSVPLIASQGVVNVNTATKEELMMLPGVGEKTATAIVDYRKANGQFKSIDEMRKIKGISKKKLDKLRPNLALAGQNTYIPSQSQKEDKNKGSKKKQSS